MPRIRTIKPEFQNSASMGRVSRDARLTFIELWPQCDDAGRVRGSSRMLASILFPYDDDAVGKMDSWLAELAAQDSIIQYEVDGEQYLAVKAWWHQKIDHPSPSKLPAPPDEKPKKTKARVREDSTKEREPSAKPRAVSSTVPERNGIELPAEASAPVFEEFWMTYPTDKNMSKKAAEKQWQLLPHEKRVDALASIPGFKAYIAANSWYRPIYADRFLSQEKFEGFAIPPDRKAEEAQARVAWGGAAAPLVDEIGPTVFNTWFGDAEFDRGPPAVIRVRKEFAKRYIEQKFASTLRSLYGDTLVEVAA
jgi:hypothetical protein